MDGCAALLAIVSVLYATQLNKGSEEIKWMIAAWPVLPPLWFMLEFHWARVRKPEALSGLKESQAVAAKLWAGVVAFLSVLFRAT